ncbi:transcriptional attenuator, LytR family [Thalassoporum mexicanum PCC 7367]|uniref:LCP family protein n=1 Tax=Thalassoporum mexicanum TaxID=3457544 RepID=UPI00029FA03F|nr:LCP family protein [Pseudanabaena sp. PCC 7367]AFY68676.1 transcriptional attenuator, LytR family [Pseudanabaena sp. PCC 7367]
MTKSDIESDIETVVAKKYAKKNQAPDSGDSGASELETDFGVIETTNGAGAKSQHRSFSLPLGKMFFAATLSAAIAAGATLGRLAPITSFDWVGLMQGRELREVIAEAVSRKLTAPYQVLILGIDRVPDAAPGSKEIFNGRSDTIMLARFDPQSKQLNMLSIPRDTRTWVEGLGTDKINAANVYGGVDLAQSTVSNTLDGVRIDRYLRISRAALPEVVNALGGVTVEVPQRMYYVDQTQGLYIDLHPGIQTLNGEQAEGFVRFRGDDEGDIGRIRRQQILLGAIRQKLSNPLTLTRLPGLIETLQANIDTNLSLDEMLAIAAFSSNLESNQVNTSTLSGQVSDPYAYSASYWLVDSYDVAEAVDGKFAIGAE